MLKEIGHKLRMINECSQSLGGFNKVKAETAEINREIVMLWLNIIMIFRTQSMGENSSSSRMSSVY
jgi:hypothetical protein